MEQTIIVTNIEQNQRPYVATALYDEGKMVEIFIENQHQKSILGNIYVGRVKDIVKNLNAAFIEIAPGKSCYYSLEDYVNPVFVKKINSPNLVQGDELLVQVVQEEIKNKPPRVTTNLSLNGKYMVLTTQNKAFGISKKLAPAIRLHLKELLEPLKEDAFGMIVRTNCQHTEDDKLLVEIKALQEKAARLLHQAPYRTCFSCLLEQEPKYLSYLQNVSGKELRQIITDDAKLHDKIKEFLQENQPEDSPLLRFYEDKLLSLAKLYSLEVHLTNALQERVWMKSGAYLVIQPTEAMTVIDVNTGKSSVKGKVQEHYLKVNLEAAKEAARQIRLRNISGIIVIDFINMTSVKDKELLMEAIKDFTKEDPVPVQVVDMTKLDLVEITRKKVNKSIWEQLT